MFFFMGTYLKVFEVRIVEDLTYSFRLKLANLLQSLSFRYRENFSHESLYTARRLNWVLWGSLENGISLFRSRNEKPFLFLISR